MSDQSAQWVLVPREATEEMRAAFEHQPGNWFDKARAMIAAAPPAPEGRVPSGKEAATCCGGAHQVSREQFDAIMAAIGRRDAEDAAEMPDEQAALRTMFRAYQRLRALGWQDAIYCPKDGSTFNVIEAGSTGVHRAHYEGKWPDGSWWGHEAGDLWPSRPILWRPLPHPPEAQG